MAANSSANVAPAPLVAFKTDFDDTQGWLSAWRKKDSVAIWRSWHAEQTRPRLYCPAGRAYDPLDYEYFAVDGMGRTSIRHQPFECTIHPYTGKFERLCVQTRDSICQMRNSTWDRTAIRCSGPRLLLVALFPYQGLHKSKRFDPQTWDTSDRLSVLLRWIPASLGISLLPPKILLPATGQPADKNPHSYLPFRYSGYRYPRIARNSWENRRDPFQPQRGRASGIDELTSLYRTFRPRYLCYLKESEVRGENGETLYIFETRPVAIDDFTPYTFISYTKEQFVVPDDPEATRAMHQLLFLWATEATQHYAQNQGRAAPSSYAFWIDVLCMPSCIVNDDMTETRNLTADQEREIADQKREVADRDVYTMSDIIRGAEMAVVLTTTSATPSRVAPGSINEGRALMGWGGRVWTLPEVILSRGSNVTLTINGGEPRSVSKVRLAELAWKDSKEARQLVEHYTTMHLSRLELVSIALKCLHERKLKGQYEGDRSYALMGLLRLRPKINTEDSSFQAFARLSLPQDNDRLMERLICLLPKEATESWDKMSDVFNSSLWDIHPLTQVCGVGENDTVIVDGFRGAMIQWSMFSTVQTMHRSTFLRKAIILGTSIGPPVLLSLIVMLLGVAGAMSKPYKPPPSSFQRDSPVDNTKRDLNRAGYTILAILVAFLLSAPVFIPRLYDGKLYEAEPCLFGIEGYVPLEEVEEMLFGMRLGRLKWSTYGSSLSRHCDKTSYCEAKFTDSHVDEKSSGRSATPPNSENGDENGYVYTHPVEPVDPCEPCSSCQFSNGKWECEEHATISRLEDMSKSSCGEMKVFMLIDTYAMTATLFEARRPPVALLVGGSEGGMKRALACSFDITTGTMCRETVLRIPSQAMDKMLSLPRVRLALKNPRDGSVVKEAQPPARGLWKPHAPPKPTVVAPVQPGPSEAQSTVV